MILVRRNELACRDKWARDLWEAASPHLHTGAGAGGAESAHPTGPMQPASVADIAALVTSRPGSMASPQTSGPLEALVAEDVVLSETRVPSRDSAVTAWTWGAEPTSAVQELDTKAAIRKAREACLERLRRSTPREPMMAPLVALAPVSSPLVVPTDVGPSPPTSPSAEIATVRTVGPIPEMDSAPTAVNASPEPSTDLWNLQPETGGVTGVENPADPAGVSSDSRPAFQVSVTAATAMAPNELRRDDPAMAMVPSPPMAWSHDAEVGETVVPAASTPLGERSTLMFAPVQDADVGTMARSQATIEFRSDDRTDGSVTGKVSAVLPTALVRKESEENDSATTDSDVDRSFSLLPGGGGPPQNREDRREVAVHLPAPDHSWDTDAEDETAASVPLRTETGNILPTVRRICRSCRDFRPAESEGRGWCGNAWAFTHRRVVRADDEIPCQTVLGNWWVPVDEVWLDGINVGDHGQATPLLDAWLPHHRGEPVRERKRS